MTEKRTPRTIRVKSGTFTDPSVFKTPEAIAKESPEVKEIAKLKDKNRTLNQSIQYLEGLVEDHVRTIRYWESKFRVIENSRQ